MRGSYAPPRSRSRRVALEQLSVHSPAPCTAPPSNYGNSPESGRTCAVCHGLPLHAACTGSYTHVHNITEPSITHTRARARTHTHTQTRTHARTHTHTHIAGSVWNRRSGKLVAMSDQMDDEFLSLQIMKRGKKGFPSAQPTPRSLASRPSALLYFPAFQIQADRLPAIRLPQTKKFHASTPYTHSSSVFHTPTLRSRLLCHEWL